MKYRILLSFIILISSIVCFATQPKIIYKPILYNKERIILTRQYRCQHYRICTKSIKIKPEMIVLHATEASTFQSTYRYFYPPTFSNGRPEVQKAGNLNVSAQFLVARNGTIYQLMPDNWMARHIIGLNYLAIGIENVGNANERQDLTQAQVNADVFLIQRLKKKYPSIKYLIGHFEYGRFRHTPLWKETNPKYFTHKTDPGPIFMHEVRQRVKNLGLLSSYQKN